MTGRTTHLVLLLSGALACASCEKGLAPEPPPPAANEGEVITTLRVMFTSVGGAEQRAFTFQDEDGDGGGIPPVITVDPLSQDSVYTAEVLVLNGTAIPTDTISLEIAEEAEDHQFFFQFSGSNASVAYNDADANGYPLGLRTTWTVGAAATGTVTVTLRHMPDKSAAGVASGDITNAGGETDIEVSFPFVVQ